MSYILDALKKANAEREHERGVAPGLYTQPARAPYESSAQNGGALKKSQALLWVLVAALLLCTVTVSALFWPLLRPDPTSQVPPQALPTQPAPPMATAPLPNTGTTNPANSVSHAPATTPSPSLGNPVRVTPEPYNLTLQTPQTSQTQPLSELPPAMAQPAPAIISRPRPVPSPPPTQAPTPAPPAPQTLPASVRAALPPLVISGSTYSDNPTYRMLIINGQVYREGEFPTPELKLEQIRQKSALLGYEGKFYVLPY